VFPLNLYARVRFFVHFCTRDRGCSAHPAFPAPSDFHWADRLAQLGRIAPRDENVRLEAIAVIAGLDPAIHHSEQRYFFMMDARVKPAHDESGAMTVVSFLVFLKCEATCPAHNECFCRRAADASASCAGWAVSA
jgi:hypothetical protein